MSEIKAKLNDAVKSAMRAKDKDSTADAAIHTLTWVACAFFRHIASRIATICTLATIFLVPLVEMTH